MPQPKSGVEWSYLLHANINPVCFKFITKYVYVCNRSQMKDLNIFKLGWGALVNFTHLFTPLVSAQQRTLSRIAMLLVQTYLEQSTPLLTPRFRIDGLPCIMTSWVLPGLIYHVSCKQYTKGYSNVVKMFWYAHIIIKQLLGFATR